MSENLKRTSLYDTHVKYGGKIVPFVGWELPVQYTAGVIAEHMAVREACGLFDVSHMGEILCTGKDAERNLNHLLTNDYTDMAVGQARYSPMCNTAGGVVDDLIVYKKAAEEFLIVVNAANTEKDFDWMLSHKIGEAEFVNISDTVGQLALQGPAARKILEKVTAKENIPEAYYTALYDRDVAGVNCMISTTGYTGEDGVELYMRMEDAPKLFEALMEAGKEFGLLPCGLGARDTLRLEAGMPLYGHEMDDTISPKEAGLGFFVKMAKEDFIGKAAIEEMGTPTRRKVGLKVVGRGIIREQQEVFVDGKKIGMTTSGTHCPYLGYPVACALVDADCKEPGTRVEVLVRGRKVEAEVVKTPFYKRK